MDPKNPTGGALSDDVHPNYVAALIAADIHLQTSRGLFQPDMVDPLHREPLVLSLRSSCTLLACSSHRDHIVLGDW